MRSAGFTALVLLSLGVAGYAVVVYGFLPLGALLHPDMRAAFNAYPVAIYAHVFARSPRLPAGPFQFWSQLRAAVHGCIAGPAAFILGIGVLVAASPAFSWRCTHSAAWLPAAGFAGLALGLALQRLSRLARHPVTDIASHRRWMVRNFSLTLAAVTCAVRAAAVASGIAFEAAYPVIAWLCWVPISCLRRSSSGATAAPDQLTHAPPP